MSAASEGSKGNTSPTSSTLIRALTSVKLKLLLKRRLKPGPGRETAEGGPFTPPLSSPLLTSVNEDTEIEIFDARSTQIQSPQSRSDGASLMLYSPLQPSEELAVEIAVSEWREWRPTTFEDLFDFDNDRREKDDGEEPNEAQSTPSPVNRGKVKVWVPSRTQLSFEFLWWGYRIYLPPPVLAVLNNKRLETAKRAAIIATAIQWLLNHIPAHTLPPQLMPFTMLLSRLPSVTSQVAALLAWSWSAVQSFDQGNGIILTATWVIPILLLPGTWHAESQPEIALAKQDTPTTGDVHLD